METAKERCATAATKILPPYTRQTETIKRNDRARKGRSDMTQQKNYGNALTATKKPAISQRSSIKCSKPRKGKQTTSITKRKVPSRTIDKHGQWRHEDPDVAKIRKRERGIIDAKPNLPEQISDLDVRVCGDEITSQDHLRIQDPAGKTTSPIQPKKMLVMNKRKTQWLQDDKTFSIANMAPIRKNKKQ